MLKIFNGGVRWSCRFFCVSLTHPAASTFPTAKCYQRSTCQKNNIDHKSGILTQFSEPSGGCRYCRKRQGTCQLPIFNASAQSAAKSMSFLSNILDNRSAVATVEIRSLHATLIANPRPGTSPFAATIVKSLNQFLRISRSHHPHARANWFQRNWTAGVDFNLDKDGKGEGC